MTINHFNQGAAHKSWQTTITAGLKKIDETYLADLISSSDWLPGPNNIFNAFSIPLSEVNYVLFGESPYPRKKSANGYAFWDAAVHDLWSDTGLSKPVNRATSLRHIIKMLLVAEGLLTKNDTSQAAIAKIEKQNLVKTNDEFFNNLIQHGFLLLNATPVLQEHAPHHDAKAWSPFTQEILTALLTARPHVTLILLGQIAKTIDALITQPYGKKLYAEHPYNLSFVTNEEVIKFFTPLHLLQLK